MNGAHTLEKLSDRHRQGAMMIAKGAKFRQVSAALGMTADYWGQLVRFSALFHECVDHYRQVCEDARLRALEAQGAKNARRVRKPRPTTPFIRGIIAAKRDWAEQRRRSEEQLRRLKAENARLAQQLQNSMRRQPSRPPPSARNSGGLYGRR